MREPAHPADQPGVYEIRATITTSGWLDDPTDDREIDTYLRQALADRDSAEVEVELEYDYGATREYNAEKWVDDHEDYWKGIDHDEY
ncbi:hypothetical protein [Corynebacterium mastitidis]|uniref:hypothetical protein n=1 Tax=Corynebacterium mastitidis TaxID=161890 RepID=UPI00254AE036|nr:hypothetical protein [Corynebacterium mastitidis]MDK8450973.1 hypothetical protein [Corynebacterium mastitidis]